MNRLRYLLFFGFAFLLLGCDKIGLFPKHPVASSAIPAQSNPPTPDKIVVLTLSPTQIPTPAATAVPTNSPTPTASPTDTPTPLPTPDGLLGGRYDGFLTEDGFVKTDDSYVSKQVSVQVNRYDSSPLTKRLVYFVVDIHIQNIESLRTASWDGKFGTRAINGKIWGSFLKMARNADAITAINGDYYSYNIHRGLVIRNGVRYEPVPWKPWEGHEILFLYRDGTVATAASDAFDPETFDLSSVWQAWEFGPSLLNEDGSAKESFHSAYSDINRQNPRTVLGYYEPGHYCFVVIDGRKSGYSDGLTLAQTAQLMESLGCMAAFNLDGGQTTQFYWNDKVFNTPYNGGRFTSDIIYIAESDSPEKAD